MGPSTGSMNGKICMVTGANSGLGKAIALGLAQMGATTVMVCRDKNKGESALAEIAAVSGNDSIELMIADLSSQQDIRRLADAFQQNHQHLHVLVNVVGVIIGKRTVTEDGLETTLAVNHLSHFMLTNLLMDILKASAPARVVNISSSHHKAGTINFDNLQGEKEYNATTVYCQSKLANVLFTYELARRLNGSGVTANCLHPGATRSNFGQDLGGMWSLLLKVAKPFYQTPATGAQTPLYLASSPEVADVSGKYFIKNKAVESSQESYDQAIAERLWQVSAELTGMSELHKN